MPSPKEIEAADRMAGLLRLMRVCRAKVNKSNLRDSVINTVLEAKVKFKGSDRDLPFLFAVHGVLVHNCDSYEEACAVFQAFVDGNPVAVSCGELEEILQTIYGLADDWYEELDYDFCWNNEDVSVLDQEGVIGVYRWTQAGEAQLIHML